MQALIAAKNTREPKSAAAPIAITSAVSLYIDIRCDEYMDAMIHSSG